MARHQHRERKHAVSDDLDALLDVLAVEHLDTYRFRGTTPAGREKRVYGGQVLAQAMHSAWPKGTSSPQRGQANVK